MSTWVQHTLFWALEIENTVNKMNKVLFFTDGAYILKGDIDKEHRRNLQCQE